MVLFTLNELNDTVTNTTGFVVQGPVTENPITAAPILDLSMSITDWNKVFAIGDNIYHTYSGVLPELKHKVNLAGTMPTISANATDGTYTSGYTLATTTGSGSGGVISSITVSGNGTDAVTSVIFGTAGSGYAVGNTITITGNFGNGSESLGVYTIVAADLNSAGGFISGSTLGTKDLTDPGTGNAEDEEDGTKLQEPNETDQTIASDAIRSFIYGITGARGQDGLYSNVATINALIDTLLTRPTTDGSSANTDLVHKLKAKIDTADAMTDTTATAANLARQLKLICLAGDADRLGNGANEIYHTGNILSNLVGELDGLATGLTDGTYTHGTNSVTITLATTGGNAVTSAASGISMIVRGGRVAGVKFTTVGEGYQVGQTLTFTTNISGSSVAMNAYTIVAGDIDNDGAFTNNLYNFLFEATDTLNFQLSVAPLASGAIGGQTTKNFHIKITMVA
tara:strand:- start:22728 stop:24092 length:1365 start_codon:yes stop_codon:yes gene_type:complete